ncbi:MAG: hypothetical protein ACFFED_09410 [Candidatus Thorarchaeota archaeon]
MVRQLAIDFLYRKHGNSLASETKALETTMAFIWAISKEDESARIRRLSRVSFPFWLVQVSPENSVLLSASTSESKRFSFTHETRLAEVRRSISNEVTEPKDVPVVVEKVLSLMDELETVEKSVRNLYEPESLVEVGPYVSELEPSYSPNRVEQTFTSQHALAESEAFQRIRDEILARVERMEELKILVSDQLRSQLKVMENIVSMEKRKWTERISSMKSSTEVATHDLEVRKSDQIYSLKEEYKRHLRAKTAEFARASTDIESYFTYLLEHVQETRATIARKQDDIESAVEEYRKLAKYLSDALPRFEEILEALNEKSSEVLLDAKRYNEALTSRTGEAAISAESEIDDQKYRLLSLEKERQESESELDELLQKVLSSIDRLEGRIKKRLLEHQSEVLDIQRSTIKNDAIHGIAPLTHLDIYFFVAEYSNGKYDIFPPGLTPENRFRLPLPYRRMNESLYSFVQGNISRLKDSDTSFKDRFEHALGTGDLFDDPDTLDLIESGLRDLQMKQLLEEGTYEKVHQTILRCLKRS